VGLSQGFTKGDLVTRLDESKGDRDMTTAERLETLTRAANAAFREWSYVDELPTVTCSAWDTAHEAWKTAQGALDIAFEAQRVSDAFKAKALEHGGAVVASKVSFICI